MTPTNPTETLQGVQVLRFFAAFLVMMTHATFYVQTRIDPQMPVWHNGEAGVAIFFVISGLVMTLGAHKFENSPSAWVAIALIVIACIAVSSLTYLWFEKPVTTYLKRKYLWKDSSASVISL